jgi:Ca2+-binding RTX toxin-like protein
MFNNVFIIVIVLFFSLLFSFSIESFLENDVSEIEYSCNENVVVCNGDETDDEIIGTDNNDIIFGWIGNDFLRGMAGDDVILGGGGSRHN